MGAESAVRSRVREPRRLLRQVVPFRDARRAVGRGAAVRARGRAVAGELVQVRAHRVDSVRVRHALVRVECLEQREGRLTKAARRPPALQGYRNASTARNVAGMSTGASTSPAVSDGSPGSPLTAVTSARTREFAVVAGTATDTA